MASLFNTISIKKPLGIWDILSTSGTDESTSFSDSRKIILLNQIAVIFFFSSFLALATFFRHEHFIANLIQLLEALSCLTALYLNRIKKYISARILIVTATSVPLFLNASYYGRETGSQLGYLTILLLVITVNDTKHKWVFLYSCLLPICCLILLELTDYSLLSSYNSSIPTQFLANNASFGFTSVCNVLIVVSLLKIIGKQQKEIEEKEQKKSEVEIQKKELDLQAVVTSLDDIVFLLDEEYIFLNVWTKDESKLFLPKEQFLGKPMKEVFGEEFHKPFKDAIDQVLATSQNQSLEYPSVTNDGAWYKATVNLINATEGEKRKVSLITKDITLQKREEKAARENFELFRLLAENTPAAMLIIRASDNIVLFANDYISSSMKVKKEDIVNHSCLRFYKNPQDHFTMLEAVEKNGSIVNFESVGIRGDGTESQALLSGTIATYLGEPVFLGFAVEITELKQAQDAVKEKDRLLVESKLAALRAQMNPHFIFNAINSIQQLVLSGSREIAYDYFSRFSILVRNILEHSDKLLIPLEDELNSLRLYIEIEALRFDDKFEYSIQADPTVINTGCKIPPLLFQPFVENAIWHGLLHKKTNRKLIVQLKEQENDLLYCLIEDNGIGRKKSIEMKEEELSTHLSKGIEVTLERMQLLNNIHDNITNFKITDLHDASGMASGTRIEFLITLK